MYRQTTLLGGGPHTLLQGCSGGVPVQGALWGLQDVSGRLCYAQ